MRLGIKPGKSTKVVPDVIKKRRYLWIPFIRGLFNAEGSIYLRYRRIYENMKNYKPYYVVQLKMKDIDPITFFKQVLECYGIKTTRITISENKYFVVRITDQKAVERFLKSVRPLNKEPPPPPKASGS